MFSNLVKYKKQAYYDQHPYLYMLTPQQSYKLHLFAGVIVDASGYILDGNGEVAYSDCSVYQFQLTQEFLQQMVNYSTFRSTTGVPSADSHIVTLSTCTYEFKNVRYVVLAFWSPSSKRHNPPPAFGPEGVSLYTGGFTVCWTAARCPAFQHWRSAHPGTWDGR